METFERRQFLRLVLGLAAVPAGAAATFLRPAEALPLAPPALPDATARPQPAIATQKDLDELEPALAQFRRRRRRRVIIVRRRRRRIIVLRRRRRRRRILIRL
jgi:hypothetical protein